MESRILFISPNVTGAGVLSRMLDPISVGLDYAPGLQQARHRLRSAGYPVVLTESLLPDGTWRDVLNLLHDLALPSSLIVTDRLADDRLWAEVLNLGAYDLLAQPFETGEVQRIVLNACPHKAAAGI